MSKIETKTCTRCEETKPVTEFLYNGNRRTNCNDCERIESSDRMRRYNKTLRGKASQALQSSRKWIKRNGYEVEDDLTLMDVIWTFTTAQGECSYCGNVTEDYHMEHIVPLAKGGPNTFSNITVACRSCNSSKSSHDLLQWRDFEEVGEVIEKMATRKGVSIKSVLEDMEPDE
ncbi:HNH endonuclease [Bacillus sp. DNRA2]|uniref:HNH endonuclease n=1 Tax=Bacillus sp. DNRA2 TaxID=2723053 RepID=UPI00145E791C|nr:HNH endonuclease signature motif containing protein [Bacillus sp. DNRA2]NMD69602.1 HNH endonuclease [Bacillus sp. DNRA2]